MAASSSAPALSASRPTFKVAGQAIASLGDALLELAVVEDTAGLYRCEARFGNWGPRNGSVGFLYFDRQDLDFGKAFAVQLDQDTLFEGRIVGLEARFPEGERPELVVLAEDRFQDLRMTRRSQTFENLSDASLVQQIANAHGLTPDVSLQGPTHKVLAQVNQSDLAFLRDRCRALGAEAWITSSTLHAKTRADRQGQQPVTLGYGHELREFTVTADLAGQRSKVTVGGWDVSGKQAVKEDADDSAVSGELDGGTSGSSILSSALGDRKEALVHTVPVTAQEAQARAKSHFQSIARRFLLGHGVADPSAQLKVGARVSLTGLGPLFNGKYYLAAVQHLFDGKRGLRTEFTAERAGLGS